MADIKKMSGINARPTDYPHADFARSGVKPLNTFR